MRIVTEEPLPRAKFLSFYRDLHPAPPVRDRDGVLWACWTPGKERFYYEVSARRAEKLIAAGRARAD